jgi:predicted phosphodiesterase
MKQSSKQKKAGQAVAFFQNLFETHPQKQGEHGRDYAKRLKQTGDADEYTAETIRSYIFRVKSAKNKLRDLAQFKTPDIQTDKKDNDGIDWRTMFDGAEVFKNLIKQHSKSQDEAVWKIKTNKPICIIVISDTHIGSWGTDHNLVKTIIDEIVNTPNLYVILAGDLTQMAIKMRSVAEVSDNLLPPKWQYKVLESIMKEIKHKVIAATWENHAAEREEKQIGYSPTSVMLEDNVIYFSGIGHLTAIVGKQQYEIGVSHLFRGRSMYNPIHSQMRYMRMEAPHLDVCVAGDSHVPAMIQFPEAGKIKVAINGGSTQTSSSYAKRYFSLKTFPCFPCFTLDPKKHMVTPYWSVEAWLTK